MAEVKNLIVGCGLSGAIVARNLADDGQEVFIIDKKEHIGGNIYDYRNEHGIMVHKYGPHIFHTNNKVVWDFLTRFTEWQPYFHKVLVFMDGQFVPLPFNLNTLHCVFPKSISGKIEIKLIEKFGFNKKVPILELVKTEDKDLRFLSQYIYENIFFEYTKKQWGVAPDETDNSVLARVPVCVGCDDRYFQDKYQGVPMNGYTAMLQKMLDHKNIKVHLNTKFDGTFKYKNLFWTGSVDEFFGYKFGELPYRSIRFDFKTFCRDKFQISATVNYPTNYDFTRITEYKYFLNDKSENTTISYEYPSDFENGKNDRQYPIVNDSNTAIYAKYMELAKENPNVYFFGRLGDYKYYDMWAAAARALEVYEKFIKKQ
ncbi:MAG: UDP-galactopyranose mutase [Elusimicrobiota bacterium]|nr:UDP-galactopyranose mutase [Elusimicrobiota bacterium]